MLPSSVSQVGLLMLSFSRSWDVFLSAIPKALHNKVARFLEGQGHVREALEITTDKDHK